MVDSILSVVRQENEVKIKGNVYRIVVRPALMYGGRDTGVEEGTGK